MLVALGTTAGLVLIPLADAQRRPALEAWIIPDPSQVDAWLRVVASGLALAFGVSTLLLATYLGRLGARIVDEEQFPPLGMWTIRDTVVLDGPNLAVTLNR